MKWVQKEQTYTDDSYNRPNLVWGLEVIIIEQFQKDKCPTIPNSAA